MEMTKQIIQFFIASGILALLIKSIVKIFLDKDFEKFKAKLERELNMHKLLHTERVAVIKNIYKKIHNTFESLRSLIRPLQMADELSMDEKTKIFVDNYNGLNDYFGENKIFFDEKLSIDIDNYQKEIFDVWNKWKTHMELRKDGLSRVKEWGQAWDKLVKEVPVLKEKLEMLFRKLIGVN